MSWDIRGTDLPLDVRINKYGLSISGIARQAFRGQPLWIDMTKANSLPADWSIYRARQAADVASLASLDVRDMKRYLDADKVRSTTTPVGVANYSDARIAFWFFLPDQDFEDVFELVKLATLTDRFIAYIVSFGFAAFLPHRSDHTPADILAYDDWLAGRPCVLSDDGFSFRLVRRSDDPERDAMAITPAA